MAGLTPRDEQILAKVVVGKTNPEIAEQLGITEGTVKGHVSRIFIKLEVRNRVEAAMKGLLGAIPEEETIKEIVRNKRW